MRGALLATSLISVAIPSATKAQALKIEITANFTKAASSINPPDPIESCDKAKKEATQIAANKGYKGKVEWKRLSVDSDCKLDTQGAGRLGFYYIFTATGVFYK